MSKEQTPPPARGLQVDFLLALAQVQRCLAQVAALARCLPEHDAYHRIRSDVGVVLNRVAALENAVIAWSNVASA
jgi:hypothetical protein